IGSHSRSLEIDLQGGIERELKRLILFLTHGCVPLERSHYIKTCINTEDSPRRKAVEEAIRAKFITGWSKSRVRPAFSLLVAFECTGIPIEKILTSRARESHLWI